MWQMVRKRIGARDGFTLIELVVVVAILGLLAVIVTPKVMGAVDNARNSSYKTSAKQIQIGMERYAAERGGYPIGTVLCVDPFNNGAINACTESIFLGVMDDYVNLNANDIVTVTYNVAAGTPATYSLVVTFGDGTNNKVFTITPSSVSP